METEIIHNNRVIVRNTFPVDQLKIGSVWLAADGGNRKVKIVDIKDGWVKYYCYVTGRTLKKDWFSFQVRYLLIIEENVCGGV